MECYEYKSISSLHNIIFIFWLNNKRTAHISFFDKNFVNFVNPILRVPVGRSGQEWYHCFCLLLGHITMSRKSSIWRAQYLTYSERQRHLVFTKTQKHEHGHSSRTFKMCWVTCWVTSRHVTSTLRHFDVVENVLSYLEKCLSVWVIKSLKV